MRRRAGINLRGAFDGFDVPPCNNRFYLKLLLLRFTCNRGVPLKCGQRGVEAGKCDSLGAFNALAELISIDLVEAWKCNLSPALNL